MRSFRDSNDVEWTVFEVRRQPARADAASPTAPTGGWLCFESESSKRRLQKFPPRWRELAETELTRLLQQATPAPRSNLSLGDNIEGGSATPGV